MEGEGPVSCPARCSHGYTRVILGVQRRLNAATGAIGAFNARRPVLVTILSVLIAIAAAIGWLRFRIESASDKLWVPQGSKAMEDQDWVSSVYVSGGGYAQFLASVNPSRASQYGSNALQLGVFWEMFQLDAAVRGISVSDGGVTYGWQDVCSVNFEGRCKYSGPLNLWSMNLTTYLTEVNGSTTDPTVGNRDALIRAVNQLAFPDGSSVSTLSIFGGITLSRLGSPPPGRPPLYMSAAEVVSMPYGLRDGLPDKVLTAWYADFLDVCKEWRARAAHAQFAFIAGNSVDLEIGNSVTKDLYLIVISVAIFVLVAVVGMSRFHAVATRSSLALLGVVSALLAMVAGYGLSLLFGCPFTTLSETLPYILLGISIDCMFILAKAYDSIVAAAPYASLEERFRRLAGSAGTSVLVTLLASAVAFALGAISELPSVRWFSVYATMGVTCIIVATLTFFIGVFVLTERRIARNRLDCCCCLTSGGPPVPTAARTFLAREAAPAAAGCPVHAVVVPAGKGGAGGDAAWPAVAVQPAPAAPLPMQAPSRGPLAEATERAGSSSGAVPCVESVDPAAAAVLGHPAPPPPPPPPRQQPSVLSEHEQEPNLMKKLFARYYAPFLTRWYGKALVLAVFAGWVVLSGVGIPRLQEGQPLSELAPDDSYLQDYVKVMKDTFQQQVGSPTALYFRWLDPAPPAQQARMLAVLGRALDDPYVNSTISAFQGNWLLDFIGWVHSDHPEVQLVSLPGCTNPFIGRVSGDLGQFVQPAAISGCVPEAAFYPLLREFLATARGYREDIRWGSPAATPGGLPTESLSPSSSPVVWSSRFPLIHTAEGDGGDYGRKSIASVRRLEDGVNADVFAEENSRAPGDVFIMSNDNYIYGEGDALLAPMTIEYVLLAVAGVGLVLSATLPSPRAVLLMMLAVGLVDYFLFGEMFILSIRFNQVSIINMIMATGLSVDYSVYFAQRFVLVTADGTRNGRMAAALTDTGSAVFVGGLTALAGTIPLAFASSTILRTFFALIFGTIAFALLVGLMLMPVVFSLVGPPPLARADAEEALAAAEGRAALEPAEAAAGAQGGGGAYRKNGEMV